MASQTTISIQYKGQSRQTLTMPPVKSISSSTNASLTEISTMIYGYRNNFCMDLGTTRRITVRFERVNPFPYNDNSSDSTKWSNGKWYRHLESMLDKWQNLCVDSKGELAGGFTFTHIPEDTTLYPTINGNVFLTGNLNMRYKNLQTIEFSLPMVLSRMTGETTPVATVTLTLKTTSLIDGKEVTEPYKVPKGYETNVPLCPDGWDEYQPGRVFMGWTDEKGERLDVGDVHTWDDDATLTARWKGVYAVEFVDTFNNGTPVVLTVPVGASRAMAYLVGAGGGAGGAGVGATGTDIAGKRYYYVGGGGGSGQVVQTSEIPVQPGAKIEVYIGKAGSAGRNSSGTGSQTDGGDGGSTRITYEGAEWTGGGIAQGGKGGAKHVNRDLWGVGGSQYNPGGTNDGNTSMNGSDGSFGAPNIESNVGKGGKGQEITGDRFDSFQYGGNGGGAASFRYRFYCDRDEAWAPGPDGTTFFESVGGDGQDRVDGTPATDGKYGGGGGSGWKTDGMSSGAGGNGCAIIVYYEG